MRPTRAEARKQTASKKEKAMSALNLPQALPRGEMLPQLKTNPQLSPKNYQRLALTLSLASPPFVLAEKNTKAKGRY